MHSGARILVSLAAAVIVVAGLKAAASLLVPLFAAAFFSVLCIPPMRRLQDLGVSRPLSIVLVVIGASVAVFLVTAVLGSSLDDFQEAMPFYRERLDALLRDGIVWLQDLGLAVSAEEITGKIDTGAMVTFVSDAAIGLIGLISNFFLVVLTVIFMLLEANHLPGKMRRARGDPHADLSDFTHAAERIQKYLGIKSLLSGLTGVLAAVLCAVLGVDFPIFWGLVAFLFNFVPNIGSIIAAVPPFLLALIEFGFVRAAIVGAGYIAINMVIGNGIEPRLMGQRLGLSTLVVFLSLVFWGWVWGPVGMLLSVPLTVIMKIMLEHSEDLRWLGVLLGPGDEDLAAPDAEVAAEEPEGGSD